MKTFKKAFSLVLVLSLILTLFNGGMFAKAADVENHFVLAGDFDSLGTWSLTHRDTITNASAPAIFGDYVLSGLMSYNENAYTSATHTVNIEKAGTYRVWVRAMTHSAIVEGNTSWKFHASVDNTQLPTTFGGYTGTNTYVWQDGGTVELSAGAHIFKLQDTYANYAKFNAFFITSDTELVPSDDYTTFQGQIADSDDEEPVEPADNSSYYIPPTGFFPTGSWSIVNDEIAYNGVAFGGSTTIAAGTGSDAVATLENVPAGTYRVWIHAKEFPNQPNQDHSWQFKAKVNGVELPVIFGGGGKALPSSTYVWEDGGTVTLNEGTNTISLVDAWCDCAKCDAIYITSNLDLDPSSQTMETLKSESNVIEVEIDYMDNFVITDDYAGGNIVVVSKMNNSISLDNKVDPEPGSAPYFYWSFQATSDTDRTVTFTFNQGKNYTTSIIGDNNKLLYSTDNGETWNYMASVNTTTFKYTFTAGETVRFTNVIPYVLDNYNKFVAANVGNERAEFTTLREKAIELGLSTESITFQSGEGREIPLIVIGNQNATKCIVYTSRHHACETIGSYTLEGMIKYMLEDASQDFLNEYCIYVVPMVDIDGVENGEQGKGRGGQDHNRDYVDLKYAETSAIVAFFEEVFETKDLKVFLDSHAPGSVTTYLGNHLSYGSSDDGNPYGTQDIEIESEPKVLNFSAILDEIENADSSIDKLTYDPSNAWRAYGQFSQARIWFTLQGAELATTIETSYTKTPHDHYADNTIRWGKQISEAVVEYLALYDEDVIEHEVVFKSNDGATITTLEIEDGEFIDPSKIPAAPERYGYTFIGWDYDVMNLPVVANTVITALYEKNADLVYHITMPEGTLISYPQGKDECNYNDRVTIQTAVERDGVKFSYWKFNGNIFSYSRKISFLMFGDVEIEAVYGVEPEHKNVVFVDSNPTITDKMNNKYDMHIMGVVYAPEGEVTEIGVLLAKGECTAEDMINGTAQTAKLKATSASVGRQFVYTIKNIAYDQARTALTYAVINGVTYYSEVPCTAIVESSEGEYGGDGIIDDGATDPFN